MNRGNPRPGFPRPPSAALGIGPTPSAVLEMRPTPRAREGKSTDLLLPQVLEYSRPRRPQR